MKITKQQLQNIIKEEYSKVLYESDMNFPKPGPADTYKDVVRRTREDLMADTSRRAASGEQWPSTGDRVEYPKKGVWWEWAGDEEGWVHRPINEAFEEDINEAGLADRATGSLKQLLTKKPVLLVFNRMKTVLDSQGEPGSPGRKEEIAAVLGALGITVADLIKIVSGMKGEEKNQPEQSPDVSL